MDMDQIIGEIGVTITIGGLPAGWWGAYSWEHHQIRLRPRLGPAQGRSVLAHELGHAWYRHRGTSARNERQASVWAAKNLIDQADFVMAAQTSHHPSAIAHQLNVLPSDVYTYVSSLTDQEKLTVRTLLEPGIC